QLDFGYPKIEQLDDGRSTGRRTGEEQILRLDVTMHDAEGVGASQAFARLHDVLDGGFDVNGASVGHQRGQVLSLQVLHDDVRNAAWAGADIVDAGHVLTFDASRSVGFAREATHQLGVLKRFWTQELER